jgi:hypothetical protein
VRFKTFRDTFSNIYFFVSDNLPPSSNYSRPSLRKISLYLYMHRFRPFPGHVFRYLFFGPYWSNPALIRHPLFWGSPPQSTPDSTASPGSRPRIPILRHAHMLVTTKFRQRLEHQLRTGVAQTPLLLGEILCFSASLSVKRWLGAQLSVSTSMGETDASRSSYLFDVARKHSVLSLHGKLAGAGDCG